jgi:NDP-sugar pyrophosphorylase family protein
MRERELPTVTLLAGGLATRMRPVTQTIPKSLLPVAGEPFLAHQLRLLSSQGIHKVVICCGYLGEQIEEFAGDGSAFNCEVRYSYDGAVLKGTGGALRKALPLLGDLFFVMYGDSYLPTSFARVYESFVTREGAGLMTVFHNSNRWDTSNVEFRNGQIICYDKKARTPAMEYIDYGLGVLRASTLLPWSDGEPFDLADVYRSLVMDNQLLGYEVEERFYEIGTPEGWRETDALLQRVCRIHVAGDSTD